mmetsp:Transcript_57987/g.64888  ORF Transcript_57987/g.64888 Transcript_57987/m.64888 type:complete len:127 (+) Transcript_57987:859-1239(+)
MYLHVGTLRVGNVGNLAMSVVVHSAETQSLLDLSDNVVPNLCLRWTKLQMAARLERLAVGSVKLSQPLQVFRTRIIRTTTPNPRQRLKVFGAHTIRTTAPNPRQGLKILQQLAVQQMAPLVPGSVK